MLSSGSVGLGQKDQSIIYLGKLGGLAYLTLVCFGRSFDDRLPDILGDGLVCVGRIG